MVWGDQVMLAAGTLIVLIVLLYAPVFGLMARQWWEDPNWSHGFLVPAFSGFVLWRERRRWLGTGNGGSWLGLVGIAWAVVLLVVGTLAAELFTTRFSFVVLLASLVLYLAGWRRLGAVAFPLGYLVFMIPWPGVLYAEVTLPLQILASRWAAAALAAVHIPVLREGNLLILANYTLEVAQACSGIRSLVSLVTVAVAYAYLAEKQMRMRAMLVALMVPIAVASNAFRIFGTGALTAEISPRLAQGFFHEFSGWLIFLTAAVLMLGAHVLLKWLSGRIEALRG
ncbi:MAG: exosortase [Acidobacteriota bacterium]|nr:exosortase [Acidobacteriota bacterium]